MNWLSRLLGGPELPLRWVVRTREGVAIGKLSDECAANFIAQNLHHGTHVDGKFTYTGSGTKAFGDAELRLLIFTGTTLVRK